MEAHLSDDDGLDVPLCGAVVRRGVAGQPGSDEYGELPKGGVLVLSRSDSPGGAEYARSTTAAAAAAAATAAAAAATATAAAADEARASALVEVADFAKTTDSDTLSPVLKPSDQAVACVRRVLDLIRECDDCKDVLRKLHVDGLVCLALLDGCQAVEGGIAANNVETEWAPVRTLLKKWWPSLSIPARSQPMTPVQGTDAAVFNGSSESAVVELGYVRRHDHHERGYPSVVGKGRAVL